MRVKKKNRLWVYKQTKEDMEAVTWCLNNGVNVGLLPYDKFGNELFIEISVRGKKHKSPQTFTPEEATKTLYSYYRYYYDKRNKQEKGISNI